VLGSGTVTIVDARRLSEPLMDAQPEQLLQRPEIQVLQLPPGAQYQLERGNKSGVAQGSLTLPQDFNALPALYDVLPLLPRL
jgi:hypothetical protein